MTPLSVNSDHNRPFHTNVRKTLFTTPSSMASPRKHSHMSPSPLPMPLTTPRRHVSRPTLVAVAPERWRRVQAVDLTAFLNFELLPPQPPVVTRSASVFLRQLQVLYEFYQSVDVQKILRNIAQKIWDGQLHITHSIKLSGYMRERDFIQDLLISNYNPHWLLLAITIVTGVDIAKQVDAAVEKAQRQFSSQAFDKLSVLESVLKEAIFKHLLKDAPSPPLSTPKRGKSSLISPKSLDNRRYNALILHRLLSLIYLLDRAISQCSSVDQPHTPLFKEHSCVSSSKDVIKLLQDALLKDQSDVVRYLALRGYTLVYVTPMVDKLPAEPVRALQEDLRDGVRLLKLAAIVTRDNDILANIPQTRKGMKAGFLRSLHLQAVRTALNTLRKCASNVIWKATPDHIVDGDFERTIELLWQIFAIWSQIFVDKKALVEELEFVRSQYRQVQAKYKSPLNLDMITPLKDSPSRLQIFQDCDCETAELLLKWAATICGMYGVTVREFTEDFCDGSALCLILHHYCPQLISINEIKRVSGTERLSAFGAEAEFAGVEKNLELFMDRCKELGNVPEIVLSAQATLAPSFQGSLKERSIGRVMHLLVAYLFRRMMGEKRITDIKRIVDSLMAAHDEPEFELNLTEFEKEQNLAKTLSPEGNGGLAVALDMTVRREEGGKHLRDFRPSPPRKLDFGLDHDDTFGSIGSYPLLDSTSDWGVVSDTFPFTNQEYYARTEGATLIQSFFRAFLAHHELERRITIAQQKSNERSPTLILSSPFKTATLSSVQQSAEDDEEAYEKSKMIASNLFDTLVNFVPRLRDQFSAIDAYTKRMTAHEERMAQASAAVSIQNVLRSNLARNEKAETVSRRAMFRDMMISCAKQAAKKADEIAARNRKEYIERMQNLVSAAAAAYEREMERTYEIRVKQAEERARKQNMWSARKKELESETKESAAAYENDMMQLDADTLKLDDRMMEEEHDGDSSDSGDYTILVKELAEAQRKNEENEADMRALIAKCDLEKKRADEMQKDLQELLENDKREQAILNEKLAELSRKEAEIAALVIQNRKELREYDAARALQTALRWNLASKTKESTHYVQIEKNTKACVSVQCGVRKVIASSAMRQKREIQSQKSSAVHQIQRAMRWSLATMEGIKLSSNRNAFREQVSHIASQAAAAAIRLIERRRQKTAETVKIAWENALESAENAYYREMERTHKLRMQRQDMRAHQEILWKERLTAFEAQGKFNKMQFEDDIHEIDSNIKKLEQQSYQVHCDDEKDLKPEFGALLEELSLAAKRNEELEATLQAMHQKCRDEVLRTKAMFADMDRLLEDERKEHMLLDDKKEALEMLNGQIEFSQQREVENLVNCMKQSETIISEFGQKYAAVTVQTAFRGVLAEIAAQEASEAAQKREMERAENERQKRIAEEAQRAKLEAERKAREQVEEARLEEEKRQRLLAEEEQRRAAEDAIRARAEQERMKLEEAKKAAMIEAEFLEKEREAAEEVRKSAQETVERARAEREGLAIESAKEEVLATPCRKNMGVSVTVSEFRTPGMLPAELCDSWSLNDEKAEDEMLLQDFERKATPPQRTAILSQEFGMESAHEGAWDIPADSDPMHNDLHQPEYLDLRLTHISRVLMILQQASPNEMTMRYTWIHLVKTTAVKLMHSVGLMLLQVSL